MSKVVVLGDMDAFRHIVASALRACGVPAVEATIGGATVTCLMEEQPDVVIVHPPQGVFERAYLEQINQYTHGARVFVVRESSVASTSDDGTVTYVSRVQVRELVDTVRRLAAPQPAEP
jgi:hypothetical protein